MPQSQSYRTELAEKRRLESIARYTTVGEWPTLIRIENCD